jgi:hypothetical protein
MSRVDGFRCVIGISQRLPLALPVPQGLRPASQNANGSPRSPRPPHHTIINNRISVVTFSVRT